jgi:hypothetical protein
MESCKKFYTGKRAPGCGCMIYGCMIYHNQDSERHEVFGVKEFEKQQ